MKHSRFFMTAPSRYMPNGRPVRAGLFYVRFYGPKVKPWGWFQASHLVHNYKEAVASFHQWAAETEDYIREL